MCSYPVKLGFRGLFLDDYTFASKLWLKLVGYNRGGIDPEGKQTLLLFIECKICKKNYHCNYL